MPTAQNLLIGSFVILAFGAATCLLASRRDWFIAFFDITSFGRLRTQFEDAIPHGDPYENAMRVLGIVELALGVILGVVAVLLW